MNPPNSEDPLHLHCSVTKDLIPLCYDPNFRTIQNKPNSAEIWDSEREINVYSILTQIIGEKWSSLNNKLLLHPLLKSKHNQAKEYSLDKPQYNMISSIDPTPALDK